MTSRVYFVKFYISQSHHHLAKVYLCSLAFNEDDAIATGAQLPDEEQRNLVMVEVDPGKVSEPDKSINNTSTDSSEADKPKLDAGKVQVHIIWLHLSHKREDLKKV